MQRYEEPVQNLRGDTIALTPMLVFLAGTETPATIYFDAARQNPIADPRTDRTGVFAFYAANGRYDVYVLVNGVRLGHKMDLLMYDPADAGGSLAALSESVQVLTDAAETTSEALDGISDKLKQIPSATDFGAVDDGLADDSAAEASAIASAMASRNMLRSLWMYKVIGRGIKVSKSTSGIKDQAAVLSISANEIGEAVTQVNGFSLASDVSVHPGREHVAVFIQNTAVPALVTTSQTTFTATTVTSSDFASALASKKIVRGMMIDTGETPKKTGTVQSVNVGTNTITVDGWYIVDSSRTTGVPATGATVYVNPCTKAWALNANIIIPANSQAQDAVGFELGLVNNKADGMGYLFDAVSLGPFKGGTAHQSRGRWVQGFVASTGTDFGFVSQAATNINFYAPGGPTGFQSDTATGAAFIAKGAAKSLLITDTSNNILSYIDGDGTHGRMKSRYATFANTSTIDAYSVVCSSVVVSSTSVINLPDPTGANANRMLYLKNPKGSTAGALFAGLVEDASGSISVTAGKCIQVISDGSKWIPIAQY